MGGVCVILLSEPVHINKGGDNGSMAFAFINKIMAFWNDRDNYLTEEAMEALDGLSQEFFDHLLNRRSPDTVIVQSLQGYVYKEMCFFHVRFKYESVPADQAGGFDLVYYGSGRIDGYINLDWTWWEGREKYRDMYREALIKGGEKVFSQEEIDRYTHIHYAYHSKDNESTVS